MNPNTITLARFPILVVSIAVLYGGTPALRLGGVALLAVGLLLDTVDGVVARRTGQATLLGSVLDIAADRAYELTLWLVYADLDLVPAAIPVIVIVRTTLTDAIRAVGVGAGESPLAQTRAGLARWLVSSSAMRTAYAAAKLIAFCGLALALALGHREWLPPLRGVAWVTVLLCVLRGAPVLVTLAGRDSPGATAAGSTAARSR